MSNNEDPRIEAVAATKSDMSHLWIVAENRCICGFVGSFHEVGHHLRVVGAVRMLAAADAVDPVRARVAGLVSELEQAKKAHEDSLEAENDALRAELETARAELNAVHGEGAMAQLHGYYEAEIARLSSERQDEKTSNRVTFQGLMAERRAKWAVERERDDLRTAIDQMLNEVKAYPFFAPLAARLAALPTKKGTE